MDTRTKIIDAAEAVKKMAAEDLLAVRLDCDPLSAQLVARLDGLDKPVLAVVGEMDESYLEIRARQELAAGLKTVRYVTDVAVVDLDLRAEERGWRGELEALVLRKSG